MKEEILGDITHIFTQLGFSNEKQIFSANFLGRKMPITQFRLFVPKDSGYKEAGDMWEYTIIDITDEFVRLEFSGVAQATKSYEYVTTDYMLNISDGYGSVWELLRIRDYLREKIREIKLDTILD